ncbi:zinc-binding alcohol dehydrogenase family protein [Nocardioides mangrovi]|uniref:Zinc-binding alcohol dehydrogenase family protein n=1 Tax=Nocardioides mangrovi TaxID=2874580 RepID=A0ABS7U6R8_9ACTN|nr:zinc-binding alcohol dehydrogenase family protein [Nocardioides mangrovi]MBZ5736676.1 zinc-binding alcohol dehydrogenase family protein [Nocardioides mangrovi]
MRAALVTSFDQAPRYRDCPDPTPTGPHETVVDVLAAGLHPRVRSQAAGSHYTSTDTLPLVPGIDGVGRDAGGTLRYFVLPDTTLGSMAERTVIDVRRSVALPDDADPVLLAAAMNPAMSSWVALRRRIDFRAGQRVVVLGATGNAGRLAVEVARHLGAGAVTAVGRRAELLAELEGVDHAVLLADRDALGAAGGDADVVLDYLWGPATVEAMYAIVPRRVDDAQRLTWVQIGSVAGLEAPIPSAALRATRLELVGSGQGSVAARDIVAELGELAAEIGRGTFAVDAVAVPLADVEQAWVDAATSRQRLVVTPSPPRAG